MFKQRERAIGMLTAGMSARDIAWHRRIDNKSTTKQISANWECLRTDPDQADAAEKPFSNDFISTQ